MSDKEEKKAVVAQEVAELEFERFAESMDIDIDVCGMDEEDLNAFNAQKRRIVRSIVGGHLTFNDDGEAVYVPFRAKSKTHDPITFHERSGASLMEMDGKQKNREVAKTYSVMGAMCKVPANIFAGLVGTDIKVCEALFALLAD
jgi:hypothetical protein